MYPEISHPELLGTITTRVKTLPLGPSTSYLVCIRETVPIYGYNASSFALRLNPSNFTSGFSYWNGASNVNISRSTLNSAYAYTQYRLIGSSITIHTTVQNTGFTGQLSIGQALPQEGSKMPTDYASLQKLDSSTKNIPISNITGRRLIISHKLGSDRSCTIRPKGDTDINTRPDIYIIGTGLSTSLGTSLYSTTINLADKIIVNGHYVSKSKVFDLPRQSLLLKTTNDIINNFNVLEPLPEIDMATEYTSVFNMEVVSLYELVAPAGVTSVTNDNRPCYPKSLLNKINRHLHNHWFTVTGDVNRPNPVMLKQGEAQDDYYRNPCM